MKYLLLAITQVYHFRKRGVNHKNNSKKHFPING
nr:MAG TPA: hypothetical protein [Caudoviricetes sp.]